MSTLTPQGGVPLTNLLQDILVEARDIEEFAIESNPDVSTTSKLIDMVAIKEGTRAGNRKAEFYRYGIKWMYQTITSRTTSGANLVLGFSDSQFEGFQVQESIRATSGKFGMIVAVSPGFVTIRPWAAETFASTDFVLLQGTSTIGVLSDTQASNSLERTTFLPFQDYNWVELSRATAWLSSEEAWTKTYLKDGAGSYYYARQSQLDALNYLMKQASKRMYIGERKADGTRYMSGGLPWQIQNQGGVYRGFSSSLSETEFWGMFDETKRNGGVRSNDLMFLGGYGYLTMFQQNVGKQYITYAGNTNTIGGTEVSGINMNQYAYGGFTAKIMEEPMLSAPGMFFEDGLSTINSAPIKSNACLLLDTNAVQGDGGNQSWVRKMYFGPQGLIRSPRSGITDIDGQVAKNPTSGQLIGVEDYVYNCCVQLANPNAHGYHALLV